MDLDAISVGGGTSLIVWLIVLFAGVAFWAFRPKTKRRSDDEAAVPPMIFGADGDRKPARLPADVPAKKD